MRVSAKVDYALRALAELAATTHEGPVKRELLANAQDIPAAFLENILLDLRKAGILRSVRGQQGGFMFARPPDEVSLAEVIRAIEGPLANVKGVRPEAVAYTGPAESLQKVWVAVRASMRSVLENVTIADVVAGRFPDEVTALLDSPEAWSPH